ncbi:unnamed protein product [Sphagnum tenellum]
MLQALNPEALSPISSWNSGKADVVVEQQCVDDRIQEQRMDVQTPNSSSDASEDSEDGRRMCEPVCVESEFEDTELEQLVLQEGPKQILQLTLQEQVDHLIKEEIWESDDYADWIEWVADEEKKRQALTGLANSEVTTLLQIQQLDNSASCKVLES